MNTVAYSPRWYKNAQGYYLTRRRKPGETYDAKARITEDTLTPRAQWQTYPRWNSHITLTNGEVITRARHGTLDEAKSFCEWRCAWFCPPGAPPIHEMDYDLCAYLSYVGDSVLLPEHLPQMFLVNALVPGEADGASWHWILSRLSDGAIFYTTASCDYTGWDCQAGGESIQAATYDEAAKLAPEGIREQLHAQLHWQQPFGLRLESQPAADAWGQWNEGALHDTP